MAGEVKSLKLYNAPAGSGKTTSIKEFVANWSIQNPYRNMLCITYTNRAANELKKGTQWSNIDVSTIHSFVSDFCRPLFKLPQIVELYLECYEKQIKERAENPEKKEHIYESNQRYKAEYGVLPTYDVVVENLTEIYYAETTNTRYFYGGLSHDDLLIFLLKIADKYPIMFKKISSKYSIIIIDEYQDTQTDILNFFLQAADENTELHLYGDRMQQIYRAPNPELAGILENFRNESGEVINYRSSPLIVSMLNNLYNDSSMVQKSYHEKTKVPDIKPKVHFVENADEVLNRPELENSLVLRATRRGIFDSIGATNLYRAVYGMDRYSYTSRIQVSDVLGDPDWSLNPDPLMRVTFGLVNLQGLYSREKYGEIIKLTKDYKDVFSRFKVERHLDKKELKSRFERLQSYSNGSPTIKSILMEAVHLAIVSEELVTRLCEDEEYENLLKVPYSEVETVFHFNQQPTESTQHGVKGESHQRVVLALDNVPNLNLEMSTLLSAWSRADVNLNLHNLEFFFLEYFALLVEEGLSGAEKLQLSFAIDSKSKTKFLHCAELLQENFKENPIYRFLYGPLIDEFLEKKTVKAGEQAFKISKIQALMTSYKIFYVGCSRAKTELDVVIPLKLITQGESKLLEKKFKEIGFEVLIN